MIFIDSGLLGSMSVPSCSGDRPPLGVSPRDLERNGIGLRPPLRFWVDLIGGRTSGPKDGGRGSLTGGGRLVLGISLARGMVADF